jgi:hypothetical protein
VWISERNIFSEDLAASIFRVKTAARSSETFVFVPHYYTGPQPKRPRLQSVSKFHSLHPEDGGSLNLRNVGILQHHCTASQVRRPRLESSSPPPKKLKPRFLKIFLGLYNLAHRKLSTVPLDLHNLLVFVIAIELGSV